MALMFQRLAQNFAKNGYFPTDSETLGRIIQSLKVAGDSCNILDPCCGEGTALAEIQHHLAHLNKHAPAEIRSYGVEFNGTRAWHSKEILNSCIHGDLRDVALGIRQFGLLFLNPPYGDSVSDKAQLSAPSGGRLRLEKEFYRRTVGMLQFEGVMVLIVPYYTLDEEFAKLISKHFSRVQIFMAPEQRFKQAVVFGVKHRVSSNSNTVEYRATLKRLIAIGNGDVRADVLPENWAETSCEQYCAPGALTKPKFVLSRLDARQLTNTIHGCPSLWGQYRTLFSDIRGRDLKRPLCKPSKWHLSLLLASGQASGVVEGSTGRRFVVRGDILKDKKRTTAEKHTGDCIERTTTSRDIFTPVIRGLDVTPGSDTYGDLFNIK